MRTFMLPFEDVNRAEALIAKAKGVTETTSAWATHNLGANESPVSDALWVVTDMLTELHAIVTMKHPEATP